MTAERFRVQFYTERADGTNEYCISDFLREAETGRSPIVDDAFGIGCRSTADHAHAEHVAVKMNSQATL